MAELIVGQVISLSGEAADKLIRQGEGDAALFCLALLRHSDAEQARKALRWSAERAGKAWEALVRLGLVSGQASAESVHAPMEKDGPPDYVRADIMTAMEEGTFQSLYQAVERRLGKKLSDADLKTLYEIYDYLALPVEVILLLITHCTQELQEKYGAGRMPKMPQIKRTAYRWSRMGIDTAEAAEEYLKKQAGLCVREREILPLLDITGRFPLEREREYIRVWVDWGFPNDTIRQAYERTVMKKQSMNWPYMNSILKNWHGKGLHTVAQVQAGDSESGRSKKEPAAATTGKSFDEHLRRDMEWLKRFSEENEMGGNG